MSQKSLIFIRKLLWLAIIIVILLGYDFWRDIYRPISQDETIISFEVKEGESVKSVVAKLKDAELVRSRWKLETYVWFKRSESKVQAGFYELNRSMTAKEIIEAFVTGSALIPERTITLIEGWTSRQIDAYLTEIGLISADEFLSIVANPSADLRAEFDFIPADQGLEGFLFPDTYRVYDHASALDIIRKQLSNFSRRTADLRQKSAPRNLSFYQALILASIIEKEVAGKDNLANAADVFLKRLDINMPLQSDATVNFVTGKKTTRPSREDTIIDSPYNTYQRRGLPPTPISNPGLESLVAVYQPTVNDYYYFLTTKDNEVKFGRTLDEHNQNRARYLE